MDFSASSSGLGHVSGQAKTRPKLLLMTKVQAIGWATASVLIALSIFAPVPEGADHVALFALACVCAMFAIAMRFLPESWLLVRASVFAGVLIIGAVIAVSQPPGMGRLLYLWPVMSAAHFLTRRDTIAVMALIALTLAPALLIAEPQAGVLMFAMTLTAFGVVAAMQRAAVEQLQGAMRKLEHAAHTDSLTGLLDRRGFLVALDRDLGRARRSGNDVTLAQFDLDRFKAINDNFGHAAGDDVLVQFAEMLSSECRGSDVAARIGGEEFAVLLFDATKSDGHAFAVRVAARLERYSAPGDSSLTVSAGVASADLHATAEQLLWAADGAVYDAKAAGRDQIIVAPGVERHPVAV